jgi:hypothetical protein
MTDLRTLHDAFAELERRADLSTTLTRRPERPRTRATRLVPVAATVVAVSALAGGTFWLAPGTGAGTHTGGTSTSTPATEPDLFTRAARTDSFAVVVGGGTDEVANFDVTQVTSAHRHMRLEGTVTLGTATGQFSMQLTAGEPFTEYRCLRTTECSTQQGPDGSVLVYNLSRTETGAPIYVVQYQRLNGASITLDISGDGSTDEPPLTAEQMATVVTSDLW